MKLRLSKFAIPGSTFCRSLVRHISFGFSLIWIALSLGWPCLPAMAGEGAADRAYQVQVMTCIARPVLEALSANKLKERMPSHEWEKTRAAYAGLEVTGRTLSGLAPWLALGADDTVEGKLRATFIELARMSLINTTDPQGPDYVNFNKGSQPLVDAAFLAYALLRAPKQLWEPLTDGQKLNPGAVRSALTAVVRRMVEAPGTFDEHGWLTPGAVGQQLSMRDGYNNSGSFYLCLDGLLALGLPPDDPYWTAPEAPWTQKRIWAGEDFANDHHRD